MLTDTERQTATEFVYREARFADEARYAEWHALWTDDAVYWVPATTDPGADPEKHLSHIYDNRTRLDTRIKLLQTGHRYSQEPPSLMRRLISNVEVERAENGEFVAASNFILAELSVQAKHEMHWWMSIARRAFPSRLELKRRAGSFRDAPLKKVSFTTFL